MIEWLTLVGIGFTAQVAPATSIDAAMTRCQDASPQRDDAAVASACSAALQRGNLSPAEVARVQALRARAYVRQNDYRHAMPDYRAAFRAGVAQPSVANGLCWTLAVLGESLDEARGACDARLREAPDDAEALDSRGLVNLKQGRFQEAWDD